MTAAPAAHDSASYSTRTCRCGHSMLRVLAPGPGAWACPSCGRRAKR